MRTAAMALMALVAAGADTPADGVTQAAVPVHSIPAEAPVLAAAGDHHERPVPMPPVESRSPGPVPMPPVEPRHPGPVPMPQLEPDRRPLPAP